MTADDARAVLLVRAFEEADRGGAVLSPDERERATRRALAGGDEVGSVVTRRAQALLDVLRDRVRALDLVLATAAARIPGRAIVWIVAFLLGAAVNALGPERRVNLLQVPLFGLILLNLAVYVLLAIRAVRTGRATRGPLRSALAHWSERAAGAALRKLAEQGRERAAVCAEAYRHFLADWSRAAGDLLAARAVHVLHVGAFLAMLGAIVAMYLRGMSTDFRVAWESTFLEPDQVAAFLRVVLAPGLAVLGGGVGDVAALRDPGGSGAAAARWIHLWAVSAAAYVLVPRAVLAWLVDRRANRLADAVPLEVGDAYYRRVLAAARGESVRVQVVPYSYTPPAPARDRLKALLHDLFGSRAVIASAAPLEYGAEAPEIEAACVLVFSLAQTPEDEVHGALAVAAKARASRERPLLAVVDAAPYRGRADAERVAERRRAWTRVLQHVGISAVHLDLSAATTDENLSAAVGGLYPEDSP